MRNLPVHWSEGMFLRPQHFQAAERFWAEVISTSDQWDHHYNYGLRWIEISEEALGNYQVQVNRCHARMRDGTIIALDQGQAPDRVDLKAAFASEARIMVYLAVPKLSLGRANVGHEGNAGTFRYIESPLSIQDESQGGNDQEIQLRSLTVRLLLSNQELAGFEVLPIAQIKRSGEAEATPQLDDEYIPPTLAIDAWPGLGLDIVRAIYDIIGEKIDVLSQRVAERGINLSSQEPGDLDDLLMLHWLNSAYTTLRCMTFAGGVHPLAAYTELCRILGTLSIFDETRRAPECPQYDHDDLARIFKWVKLRIESLIGTRQKLEYEQRFFVGTDQGMEVAIKPEWLHSGWNWYVGVHAENISERECRQLLEPGSLDWKMGSAQQVGLIFKHGMPGVTQIELSEPPRALPARRGWIYYEVSRDNNAWKDVLASQTLALRFRTELIGNLEKLRGQQKLEVLAQGKRAILQFALFAVQTQKK